jgi:hypothetical protein
MPFGATTNEGAALARELSLAINVNYGHAGRRFIQYLLDQRAAWDEIASIYRQLVASYVQAAHDSDLERLAGHMAAIHTAAIVAHEALELDGDTDTALASVWGEIVGENTGQNAEERALRDVMSWAYGHEVTFRDRDGGYYPTMGWSGIWELESDKDGPWSQIAFFPDRLKKLLNELGYEPEAVISGWKERGWLIVDTDRASRTTKRIKRDGETHPMVVISREAIEAVDG